MPEKQIPETEAQNNNVQLPKPEKGAQEISAADQAEIIRKYEQARKKEESADDPESRYSRMQNAIRRPMYNVLLAGALVVNPVVTGGIWATRKAADKVLGNIPVISSPYKGVTKMIDKGGNLTLDAFSSIAALPAVIPDRLEDVKEVLTNTVRTESKGFIGSTMETITETSLTAVKKTAEALTFTVKKSLDAMGWTVTTLTEPVRTLINGYAKALVSKPIPTVIGTALVAGGIASVGALVASESVFTTVLSILQGIAKSLGVPVPAIVP